MNQYYNELFRVKNLYVERLNFLLTNNEKLLLVKKLNEMKEGKEKEIFKTNYILHFKDKIKLMNEEIKHIQNLEALQNFNKMNRKEKTEWKIKKDYVYDNNKPCKDEEVKKDLLKYSDKCGYDTLEDLMFF